MSYTGHAMRLPDTVGYLVIYHAVVWMGIIIVAHFFLFLFGWIAMEFIPAQMRLLRMWLRRTARSFLQGQGREGETGMISAACDPQHPMRVEF